MPHCVLKTCQNHSRLKDKSSGVGFHRFLRPGEEQREKWIAFVRKNRNEKTWLPSDHSYICSDHFKDEDKYETKGGKLFLKKCALPYDKNVVETVYLPISESLSDSESIFDSSREIDILKRKLLKETTAKKQLGVRLRKVQRQNRYLKKKCKTYKLQVQTLKKNLDQLVENEIMSKAEIQNK